MTTAKAAIIIVTRNSKVFMPSVLNSLSVQTFRDFQTVVIDNASSDSTAELVRRNYPAVAVIENTKNLGFAKANNQGIRSFKSEYIVLCNPDIVLEKDWLEKMIGFAETEEGKKYDVFGGKLLKLKMIDAESGEMEKTDVIDSCGLKVMKNHRIVEFLAGEKAEVVKESQEVFGHGAALIMIRRSALEAAAIKDEFHPQGDYFDGSFFFYKEDVDLAWRMRLTGFRAILVAAATAYHLRTFSGSDKASDIQVAKEHQNQSAISRYYSYRNHLLILAADEFTVNKFRFFPQIFWHELKKFGYMLIFETKNLGAWIDMIKMIRETKAKRRAIIGGAKISAGEIRKWYN